MGFHEGRADGADDGALDGSDDNVGVVLAVGLGVGFRDCDAEEVPVGTLVGVLAGTDD